MFKSSLEGIQSIIEFILSSAINSDTVFQALSEFNPTVYSRVTAIMITSVRVVAYTMLSLFFMLELLNISTKTEGMSQGSVSVEVVFKSMFKMILCKLAVDQSKNILEGIYEISLYLAKGISNITGVSTVSPSLSDLITLGSSIGSLNMGDQLFAIMISFVVILITSLVVLYVNITLIARFFQIYIMLAIAPIPLATLAHGEHSQIAKSFLKSFTAVCLHGVLIFIILSFFPLLADVRLLGFSASGTNIALQYLSVLGYPLLLGLAVASSQSLAKKICNAM